MSREFWFEEFPEFSKQGISNLLMFHDNFEPLDGTLISLRSLALALTLSGLAGGEYLPLPRSEGGVFPLLLILDGYPNASANVPQGHEGPQN